MIKRCCKWILFNLICLNILYALPTQVLESNSSLNFEQANKQLTQLEQNIKQSKFTLEALNQKVIEMTRLRAQATNCVNRGLNKLTVIQELLKSIPATADSQPSTSDFKYLSDKQAVYTKQISECRLLVFRSNENLLMLKEIIRLTTRHHTLKATSPIWEILKTNQQSFNEILFTGLLYQRLGLYHFNYQTTFFWLSVLGITAALGNYIKKKLTQRLQQRFTQQPYQIFIKLTLHSLRKFIQPICLSLINFFYLSLFLANPQKEMAGLLLISKYFLGFTINFIAIDFCLQLGRLAKIRFFTAKFNRYFLYRLILLASLFVAYTVLHDLIMNLNFSISVLLVNDIFWFTLISAALFYLLLLLINNPLIIKKKYSFLAKLSLSTSMIILLSLKYLGYHELSKFILIRSLWSAGLITSAGFIIHLGNKLHSNLTEEESYFSQRVHYYLGIKIEKIPFEITLLKYMLNLVSIILTALSLLDIWNVSHQFIAQVTSIINEGFTIGNLRIIPVNLLIGVIIFSLLNLSNRFFSTYTSRKETFKGTKATQTAIASLINYFGLPTALVISCIVAGVDFTGLAIITGGLSVGIGLGLQNIVNNFVSGMILLIEKPIKPGDRINLGNTEGIVKKIRFRSTHISTFGREDIIMPNSELISRAITNYTYQDKLSLLVHRVEVSYGSDINLVEKILLSIANEHPRVLHSGNNHPTVNLKAFGENNLVFELIATIDDVNQKGKVINDFNRAIDQIFKTHHLNMAYPQREVHLVPNE